MAWRRSTAPDTRKRRLLRSAALVGLVVLSGQTISELLSQRVERFCSDHQLGCSLFSGFVNTGLLALAGYFLLIAWTLRRAVHQYAALALRSPERLFAIPPTIRVGDVVGRERLMEAIASELRYSAHGAPLLLVGDAGSGKSTFMLAFTRYIAERGWIPVPISLRSAAPPLDFRALAQQEFIRHIDPFTRSSGEAEKIWRRLTARGVLVVLADGLDEALVGMPTYERDRLARSALLGARKGHLPVVVTSRRDSVPFGTGAPRFELGPLDSTTARTHLERLVGPGFSPDRAALDRLLETGYVLESPFYLGVTASLYRWNRLGIVDTSASREFLLTRLLDEWLDLLEESRLVPQAELQSDRRSEILRGLQAIAYLMLLWNSLDCKLSTLKQAQANKSHGGVLDGLQLDMIVEGASRLQLVQTFSIESDECLRFNHAISQSYLASRFLRSDGGWEALVHETSSSDAMASLVMYCAALSDAAQTETVYKALLARSEEYVDDRALSLVMTATEIARALGRFHLEQTLSEPAATAWSRASAHGRMAAVERLRGWDSAWAFRFLLACTHDANYGVRWNAAQAIVAGGDGAYETLRDDFHRTMEYGEARPCAEWEPRQAHEIAILGWLLPGLQAIAERSVEIEALVARLSALVPERMPLGTEASLAQGFKAAAVHGLREGQLHAVADLLGRCAFWYSRIIALHALAIHAHKDRSAQREARAYFDKRLSDDAEHPFVREAARLCQRALKAEDWAHYVWDDESAAVMKSGSSLAAETNLLLGDMVLLLNLTEQGDVFQMEERKERTYRWHKLPYCLASSRDRRELFTECAHTRCDFRLCPYPGTTAALARGEFGEPFTRQQLQVIQHAHRLGLLRRRPLKWSRCGQAAFRELWEVMADRGSY